MACQYRWRCSGWSNFAKSVITNSGSASESENFFWSTEKGEGKEGGRWRRKEEKEGRREGDGEGKKRKREEEKEKEGSNTQNSGVTEKMKKMREGF